MKHWKQFLIAASAGASVALFLRGKNSAGLLVAGVGLVAAATEYPEKFEDVRRKLPEYLDTGNRLMETASRISERLADYADGGGRSVWSGILSR